MIIQEEINKNKLLYLCHIFLETSQKNPIMDL